MQFLERFLIFPIDQLLYVIIAMLIAFTVHEFSHAYTAYRFGDPTAKNEGRLTLNPAAHLDLLGTIMIFIAGFGWAKPVPVNYFHFKNKKLAGVLVSVAGPLSNLLVAAITMGLWYFFYKIQVFEKLSDTTLLAVSHLFDTIISLNLILFVFNLLPIPPLDGYRVIEDISPKELRPKLIQMERYGVFIFLILFVTPLGDYVFIPIFNTFQPLLYSLLQDMFLLIFGL